VDRIIKYYRFVLTHDRPLLLNHSCGPEREACLLS